MQLKLLQKERLKKQQKQLMIRLEIILLTKLQESQKRHQIITQKQMKKKYLEKDLYPHN